MALYECTYEEFAKILSTAEKIHAEVERLENTRGILAVVAASLFLTSMAWTALGQGLAGYTIFMIGLATVLVRRWMDRRQGQTYSLLECERHTLVKLLTLMCETSAPKDASLVQKYHLGARFERLTERKLSWKP